MRSIKLSSLKVFFFYSVISQRVITHFFNTKMKFKRPHHIHPCAAESVCVIPLAIIVLGSMVPSLNCYIHVIYSMCSSNHHKSTSLLRDVLEVSWVVQKCLCDRCVDVQITFTLCKCRRPKCNDYVHVKLFSELKYIPVCCNIFCRTSFISAVSSLASCSHLLIFWYNVACEVLTSYC